MINQVTVDMVSCFQIYESHKKWQCEHDCNIDLKDGREEKVELSGIAICALIQAIAKEKIVNPLSEDHFSEYNQTLEWQKKKGILMFSADNILGRIFRDTILEAV